MKKLFVTIAALAMAASLSADRGMWLPSRIGEREKDMKSLGFQLTAADVYSDTAPSLKDCIVRFGRGCTGEVISGDGLVLTNHHCAMAQIQAHSGIGHDYLTDGFWAMNRGEELPTPGLTVTFLVRMEEVTAKAVKGTQGLSAAEAKKVIEKNIDEIIKEATAGTHYKAEVIAAYSGNEYYLYVNEIFKDVRMVGVPPSSIGKFAGDDDNWSWPRHTGDFSMFRVYAGKDNKPAEYSEDNVPYKPRKFLKMNVGPKKEGDFTMIYGYPGTTQQYLVSSAVDYVLNHSNPLKIDLRTKRIDIMKAEMDKDPAVRIAYAAKIYSVSNSWKKWQGESLGLRRLGTIAKKQAYEKRFNAWAADKPEYKNVVADLIKEYKGFLPYAVARDYYNEGPKTIELLGIAKIVADPEVTAAAAGTLPDELAAVYKDYYVPIDRAVAVAVLTSYMENVSSEFIPAGFAAQVKAKGGVKGYVDYLFDNSAMTSQDKMKKVYASAGEYKKVVENDPAMAFYKSFNDMYKEVIGKNVRARDARIAALNKTYVKGQMEYARAHGTSADIFPDANRTLRVAYGKIEGSFPQDAMWYVPFSTLEGVIAKDNPALYDYNIPQRLREVHAARDYGRWAVDGTVPVCFLATNHSSGGNSGSPILNGRGELIGTNFDRTWLSTMSDIEFDPAMCRNISVDVRYVLFVVDKIGGASYLFKEMVLVE